MRTLVRTIGALALAVLVALVPAAAVSAKQPKAAAWAKKHDLSGSWRGKDADADGVKNLAEFRHGTNPRKADSDRDGLKDGDELASDNDPLAADSDGDGTKDGAEHAGVVIAFDGETITLRQFKGQTITATVDDSCGAGEDDGAVDSGESDWSADDEDGAGDGAPSDDESDVDVGDDGDADASCDFDEVEEDDVLNQAEFETRGGVTVVTGLVVA